MIFTPTPLPPPAPHFDFTPYARKKPNITLNQLEALHAAAGRPEGEVFAGNPTCRALVRRKLARFDDDRRARISALGRILIGTQYKALKKVLQERSK